ncbi:hypothetical protein ULF88_24270 [Halopseudomonas pachastrellae]|nr:hypothetical protein [Halopseudomonas pachastrellae]MED5491579.1 hypothetical protein [Pseudomonadota bacterium]|tara:strand:- start:4900 stop:5043 length:144 start_codon:yes stop_codon:yes gene_type:complete
MTTNQHCRKAVTPPAFLHKTNALLLALQPVGPDLILLLALEVLLWTA